MLKFTMTCNLKYLYFLGEVRNSESSLPINLTELKKKKKHYVLWTLKYLTPFAVIRVS